MTLWRLEWVRLVRTKRLVALVGIYVFFGLIGPFAARYLQQILDSVGGDLEGATIVLPPPEPVDGLAQFSSNAAQLGLLVAVVVAAGALTIDAKPEMGVFLRTRVESVRRLLWPRLVVTTAALVAAFVLGALAAWYESVVLIGTLPAGRVLIGIGYGVLYLAFVVTVVAAAAGWARSVLGTVMIALVVLIVMPIVGSFAPVGDWLPSRLVGALTDIPSGESPGAFLAATVVTVAAAVAALGLALRGAAAREL